MDYSAVLTTPGAVFLLDDHEIVRRGLSDLLEAADGIAVVGEASTPEQALNRIPAVRPDVALLDARLPDDDFGGQVGTLCPARCTVELAGSMP